MQKRSGLMDATQGSEPALPTVPKTEFRGTAREGHSELRVDLAKLMCDLPTVVERAEDILLEVTMLFGPCSDPTQMGCASGLDKREGCLVPLITKPRLPRSLLTFSSVGPRPPEISMLKWSST